MDEQLKKFQAPPRTAAQIDASKHYIEQTIEARNKKAHRQYYGTLVAACAVLVLLAVTYFSTPTTLHPTTANIGADIKAVYAFKNQDTQPIYNIDKWYYTDKTKITNKEKVDFLQKYAVRLKNSTSTSIKNFPETTMDYMLIYADGTKQYLQFYSLALEDGVHILLRDATTHQIIDLANHPDAEVFMQLTYKSPFITGFVKLFICFTVLMLALKLFQKLQLTLPERNASTKKSIFTFIGLYLYYVLFKGTSYYLFGTVQGIFMLLLALPFALRRIHQYRKTKDRRYLHEIPLVFVITVLIVFIINL